MLIFFWLLLILLLLLLMLCWFFAAGLVYASTVAPPAPGAVVGHPLGKVCRHLSSSLHDLLPVLGGLVRHFLFHRLIGTCSAVLQEHQWGQRPSRTMKEDLRAPTRQCVVYLQKAMPALLLTDATYSTYPYIVKKVHTRYTFMSTICKAILVLRAHVYNFASLLTWWWCFPLALLFSVPMPARCPWLRFCNPAPHFPYHV